MNHVIGDVAAFYAAIEAMMPFVSQGWLVTFGIAPDVPETGYGWIQRSEQLQPGINRIARFVEKPPLDQAQAMLASGDHAWNRGYLPVPSRRAAAERFGVAAATLHRFFPRHGITKKTGYAVEQDRADVLSQWKPRFDGKLDLDPARLVFIDETWTAINMTRSHGMCFHFQASGDPDDPLCQ